MTSSIIIIITIFAILDVIFNHHRPFIFYLTVVGCSWISVHVLQKTLQTIRTKAQLSKSNVLLNAIDNHPRDDIIAVTSLDGAFICGNRQFRKMLVMYDLSGRRVSEPNLRRISMALAKQAVATGQSVRQFFEFDGDMYDLAVAPFELEHKEYAIFSARRFQSTGAVPYGITFDPDTGVVSRVSRKNGSLRDTTLFRIGERGIFVYDKDAREEVPFGWDTLRDLAERVIPNPA